MTLIPFVRDHKKIQMYLVSRDSTTSTFSEFHGCMRSWLPEAPSIFLRGTGLLK